jgi:hypothetical protein
MKHCCYPVGEPRFIPVEEFKTPLTKRDQINFEGFMSVTVSENMYFLRFLTKNFPDSSAKTSKVATFAN